MTTHVIDVPVGKSTVKNRMGGASHSRIYTEYKILFHDLKKVCNMIEEVGDLSTQNHHKQFAQNILYGMILDKVFLTSKFTIIAWLTNYESTTAITSTRPYFTESV